MNHHLEMETAMQRIPKGEALLLHACCAPCSSVALQRLSAHFRIVLYYYNPNIAPEAEYIRRLDALRALARQYPAAYPVEVIEAPYAPEAFAAVAAGLEAEPEGGARCTACFALRLNAAARRASALGIGLVGTTLTTGPRKPADTINTLGNAAAARAGVAWLPADFKKKDGVRQSAALCAEYGLYRQNYCGCAFSLPSPLSP